jgi:hypothetical protein
VAAFRTKVRNRISGNGCAGGKHRWKGWRQSTLTEWSMVGWCMNRLGRNNSVAVVTCTCRRRSTGGVASREDEESQGQLRLRAKKRTLEKLTSSQASDADSSYGNGRQHEVSSPARTKRLLLGRTEPWYMVIGE